MILVEAIDFCRSQAEADEDPADGEIVAKTILLNLQKLLALSVYIKYHIVSFSKEEDVLEKAIKLDDSNSYEEIKEKFPLPLVLPLTMGIGGCSRVRQTMGIYFHEDGRPKRVLESNMDSMGIELVTKPIVAPLLMPIQESAEDSQGVQAAPTPGGGS